MGTKVKTKTMRQRAASSMDFQSSRSTSLRAPGDLIVETSIPRSDQMNHPEETKMVRKTRMPTNPYEIFW
jgi:hypothetical protein